MKKRDNKYYNISLEMECIHMIVSILLKNDYLTYDIDEAIEQLPIHECHKDKVRSIWGGVVVEYFDQFISKDIVYKYPNEC